jgi:hypothetical protein
MSYAITPGRYGFGDDVARTPAVDLIAQVNRFTREGQFGSVVYPLVATGTVPVDVARTAIVIHQTRLITAQAGISDFATAIQISEAAKGLSSPVGFVTSNMPMITASVAGYAEMKGLAPASYAIDQRKSPSKPLPIVPMAIAAGVLAAYWFLTRKG